MSADLAIFVGIGGGAIVGGLLVALGCRIFPVPNDGRSERADDESRFR